MTVLQTQVEVEVLDLVEMADQVLLSLQNIVNHLKFLACGK